MTNPLLWLFNFFHSWLHFIYAMFTTKEIGPPIIADRLTGRVERELETVNHRFKMYLMYNYVTELLDRTLGVRKYLHYQSVKAGRAANQPFSESHDPNRDQIREFIETYKIDTSEFALQDPKSYKSFNDFFSRELKPGARSPKGGPNRIVSAADSKLVVYPKADLARKIWIKNKSFTMANMIGAGVAKKDVGKVVFVQGSADGDWKREAGTKWMEEDAIEVGKMFEGGAIASFRLNVPDYHRFHSPCSGTIESMITLPGSDYEVDPYVTTSKYLGVLTGNERVVLRLRCEIPGPASPASQQSQDSPLTATTPTFNMLFIPIGAQDVGTVSIHPHIRPGYHVERGEELGMFAFGGSNIIVAFEPGVVEWDGDLEAWSMGRGPRFVGKGTPEWDKMEGQPIECFVRAGDGIGTVMGGVKSKTV